MLDKRASLLLFNVYYFYWNTLLSPLYYFGLWKSRFSQSQTQLGEMSFLAYLYPTQGSVHCYAHSSCSTGNTLRLLWHSTCFWNANVPHTAGKPRNTVTMMWKPVATRFPYHVNVYWQTVPGPRSSGAVSAARARAPIQGTGVLLGLVSPYVCLESVHCPPSNHLPFLWSISSPMSTVDFIHSLEI